MILECLQVKYFTLPVGDMNTPNYKKITEGIDFIRGKPYKLFAEH